MESLGGFGDFLRHRIHLIISSYLLWVLAVTPKDSGSLRFVPVAQRLQLICHHLAGFSWQVMDVAFARLSRVVMCSLECPIISHRQNRQHGQVGPRLRYSV